MSFREFRFGRGWHILELPPEILVIIFEQLTNYKQIEVLQLTCTTFKKVGALILNNGVHDVKRLSDRMAKQILNGEDDVSPSRKRSNPLTNEERKCILLSHMCNILHASVSHFIKDEVYPLCPGALIDDYIEALNIARMRNPQLDKDGLQKLVSETHRYRMECEKRLDINVDPALVLSTLLDLLQCLTMKESHLQHTHFGVYYHCVLLCSFPYFYQRLYFPNTHSDVTHILKAFQDMINDSIFQLANEHVIEWYEDDDHVHLQLESHLKKECLLYFYIVCPQNSEYCRPNETSLSRMKTDGFRLVLSCPHYYYYDYRHDFKTPNLPQSIAELGVPLSDVTSVY